jgi:anti-anti-sigma factor
MAYSNIKLDYRNEKAIISFRGNSKLAGSVNEMIDAINEAAGKEKKEMILDLDNMGVINSQEIGLLAKMQVILKKRDKKLSLVNVRHYVRNALEATKIDQLIKIYESIEEAYGAEKKQETGYQTLETIKGIEDLLK